MRIFLLMVGFVIFVHTHAQSSKTDKNITFTTFTVHGDCRICKRRIEDAAKSVNGVKTAIWDQEFQTIKVSFDSKRTNENKIHKAIANVGHDTNKEKAEDKVYKALPTSCRYRKKK